MPDSLLQKEQQLLQKYTDTKAYLAEKRSDEELIKIRNELNDINIELDNFKTLIRSKYPKYAAIKYQNNNNSPKEIQAILDSKTAIVEYQLSESSIYIFYVDKNQIKVEEVAVDNEVLTNNIKSLHEALSNYSLITEKPNTAYQNYTRYAHWFYEKLIEPIMPYAKEKENLLIIPDGELGHLPFETFLTRAAPQDDYNYNKLNYLIQQYNISYDYSSDLWKESQLKKAHNNSGQILGVASNYDLKLDSTKKNLRLPSYLRQRGTLSNLPTARKEVESLEKKFNGFFAYNELANEKTFKEKVSNYSIIHLAMHGLLDQKNLLYPH